MWSRIQRWASVFALGSVAALGGLDCGGESGLDAGYGYETGYYADDYSSYGGEYYGFYESDSTHSFVTGPGLDAGDALETYLGSYVSYP